MKNRIDTRPHPGILINKIGPTGFPGALFVLGVTTLVLAAFPQLAYFLLGAIGLGGFAAYFLSSRRPQELLSLREAAPVTSHPMRQSRRRR